MTRNPRGASLATEVVRGDFDDQDSLDSAVAGVGAVFLLDAPGPWIGRHDLAMLDAARSRGVEKVVKLSAIGTGDDTDVKVGGWHLPGEQALHASGTAWTILRPSSFASNTLSWAPMIRAGQPVPNMTASGSQGVVDPLDVAEVAVAALTEPGHQSRTYTLTGPELLSVPEQAAVLGKLLGRTVETVDVPLDAARRQMLAAGLDPQFVEVAMHGQRLIMEGGNARLTDDVATVLGRPAHTYAEWAERHRSAFDE